MIAQLRVAGQIAVFIAVFAGVAALSDWPSYHQIPPQSAVVKLSFTHVADRVAACRERTKEELEKLPPNMRNPLECSRRRGAVYVELDIDGRTVYRGSLQPSGLSGDGPARVYERFVVPVGAHGIAVRMRDTGRSEGFDHAKSGEVVLASNQNFVIDFRREANGFVFQ
ncbi:MAG: hypothetical protein IT539_11580 [Bradyrhizobiaceae bacterium]|nr:hypothetical protein [Bradyrhizobiaceae bacterium]